MNQELALIGDNNPPTEQTTSESKAVAVFGKFDLAEVKKANAEFVFDYETKKGRDEARSHIFKLQKSRVAIEKAGKAERADSIAYQKAVISEEGKLTAVLEEMIDLHKKPLEEWEAKEAKRIEDIRARIDGMKVGADHILGKTATELRAMLSDLAAILTGEGFDEFADQAYAMKTVSVDYLQQAIAAADKAEQAATRLLQLEAEAETRRLADEAAAEAKRVQDELDAAAKAEIERLAEESRQRDAAEQKRIADAAAEAQRIAGAEKKAAEEARSKAEVAAAERERLLLEQAETAKREAAELAERQVREAQEASDRHKAEIAAAEEKRIREAKEAADRQAAAVAEETKRIADEAAAQKAVDDARAADRDHRAKINRETLTVLTEVIGTAIAPEDQAKAIITAVALGKIPHLQINY